LAQIPQLCCCNFGIWRFRRRRFFHRDRIHRRADRRSDFRPSGSQADVHVRRRALRYLGLRLLRRIVHWLAGDRRPCHRSLIYSAWDSVRSPGSIDRRELPGTNTLQRLIDWLSACPSWAAAWLPSLQPHCWPGTAVAIWSPVTC